MRLPIGDPDKLRSVMQKARSGGWSAVPNSKHGGQRKRSGSGYSYRYPDGKGGWQAGAGRRQAGTGKRAKSVEGRLKDHKAKKIEDYKVQWEKDRQASAGKRLKATMDKIAEEGRGRGVKPNPPFDWAGKEGQAQRMTGEQLEGALKDIIATLPSARAMDRENNTDTEGKYTDEASVYRKELTKRKQGQAKWNKMNADEKAWISPVSADIAFTVMKELGREYDHARTKGARVKWGTQGGALSATAPPGVTNRAWVDVPGVFAMSVAGRTADDNRHGAPGGKHKAVGFRASVGSEHHFEGDTLKSVLDQAKTLIRSKLAQRGTMAKKSMIYTVPRKRFVLRKGAGWSSIPTGKKGGQRQPDGKGGWRYRYPDGKGGYSSSPSKGGGKSKAKSKQSSLDFGGGEQSSTPRGARVKPAFQPIEKEAAPQEEQPKPSEPKPAAPAGGLMRVELPGEKSLFINQAPEPLKEGAMSKEGYAAGDGPYQEGDVLHPDHKDEASAYVIDDYPYGRNRTQMRVWVETDKKGAQRIVRQTQNPKTDRWNNPKKSTYSDGLVAKFDEKGHIGSLGISIAYRSDGAVEEFLKQYGGHMDPQQIARAAGAAAYDAAGVAGMGHQEKLKAANDMLEKLSPKGEDKPKKKASPRTRYNEALTHENDPAGYSKQLTSDVKKMLKKKLGVTSIKQGYKGSGGSSHRKQLWIRFANGKGIDIFLEGDHVKLGGVQRSGFGKVDATRRSSYAVAYDVVQKLKSISQEGQAAGEWD